jgi:hypothetical protein
MEQHSLIPSIMTVLAVALPPAVAAAVGARGADPIIGSWKLNIAKSTFPPTLQAGPKEHTEVYREIEGDQIELIYASSAEFVGRFRFRKSPERMV